METIKITRAEKNGLTTEYFKDKNKNKVVAFIEFPCAYSNTYSAISVVTKSSGFGSEHQNYEDAKKCICRYLDSLYCGNVELV